MPPLPSMQIFFYLNDIIMTNSKISCHKLPWIQALKWYFFAKHELSQLNNDKYPTFSSLEGNHHIQKHKHPTYQDHTTICDEHNSPKAFSRLILPTSLIKVKLLLLPTAQQQRTLQICQYHRPWDLDHVYKSEKILAKEKIILQYPRISKVFLKQVKSIRLKPKV